MIFVSKSNRQSPIMVLNFSNDAKNQHQNTKTNMNRANHPPFHLLVRVPTQR